MIYAFIPVVFLMVIAVGGLLSTFDFVHLFIARLTGKEIIQIEGVSSAIDRVTWKAWIDYSELTGRPTAWRYPAHRIGVVILNEDNTGYYCGDVIWKRI